VPDDSLLPFLCFAFFGQPEVGRLYVTSEGTAAEIKTQSNDRKKSRKIQQHNKKEKKDTAAQQKRAER
jgi:3'-phosphoadenosine 5'-phosphosulfate (PAPS) 3'-phosphatase